MMSRVKREVWAMPGRTGACWLVVGEGEGGEEWLTGEVGGEVVDGSADPDWDALPGAIFRGD